MRSPFTWFRGLPTIWKIATVAVIVIAVGVIVFVVMPALMPPPYTT